MEIDKLLIERKFGDARPYLVQLEKYAKLSEEEFSESFEILHLSERIVEIIAQIIIDVCMHISSRKEILSPPETYASCIRQMEQLTIISKELSIKLQKFIQLRNLIIHQYGKIDPQLLHKSIKLIRDDFSQFQQSVLNILNNNDK